MRSKSGCDDAMEPKWLNEREVSKLTGIAVQTLRNWRSRRTGPKYSIAGARMVRYLLSDLIDFMEQRKVDFDKE
jgi:predicted DNA-binding transcriptional regulator AlpA